MLNEIQTNTLKKFLIEGIKNKYEILFDYSGPFDRDTITNQVRKINEITKKYPQAQRKLFYVYIELAQNVGYYSDEREVKEKKDIGIGSVIFFQNQQNIGFTIGNLIKNSAYEVLKKKCDIINSMNREELRLFKRQQRNLIPGTNGNAHIGLIMVALTTRKPLQIKRKKINQTYSYFSITVEVEKN